MSCGGSCRRLRQRVTAGSRSCSHSDACFSSLPHPGPATLLPPCHCRRAKQPGNNPSSSWAGLFTFSGGLLTSDPQGNGIAAKLSDNQWTFTPTDPAQARNVPGRWAGWGLGWAGRSRAALHWGHVLAWPPSAACHMGSSHAALQLLGLTRRLPHAAPPCPPPSSLSRAARRWR